MRSNNLLESSFQVDYPFRLLVAPGITQLLSGCAGIRLHETKTKKNLPIITVVYGLYSERTRDFIETLEEVALQLGVKKVVYIDDKDFLSRINSFTRKVGFRQLISKRDFYLLLGSLAKANELWLNRNFTNLSRILQLAYPGKSYCYGDGPGIFISESNPFFFTESSFNKKSYNGGSILSKRNIFSWLQFYVKPKIDLGSKPKFNSGYFLFPDGMGEFPSFSFESKEIDLRAFILKLFSFYGPGIFFTDPAAARKLEQADSILLFMSSNHSEANRLKMEDEIEGYVRKILSYKDHLVVIKPHPRDSKLKIDLLVKKLKENSVDLLEANSTKSQFLPIEILLEFLVATREDIDKLKLFTSSTVAYTLALYYKLMPEIGFGEDFIRQYFYKDQVESRIMHDDILRKYSKDLLLSK